MSYGEEHGHDDEGHHAPQSFWTKYVWSQDHKVIAIQYTLTALFIGTVGLILSDLMRLQLGFPANSSSSTRTAITSSSPCTA